MISQKYRFHGHASLKYLLTNGNNIRGNILSIKIVDNSRRKYSRVAIIISKKVLKHAVDRNRARRRLYEIVRPMIGDFNRTVDLAIIVYKPNVINAPHDELVAEVTKCLQKAELLNSNNSTSSDKI